MRVSARPPVLFVGKSNISRSGPISSLRVRRVAGAPRAAVSRFQHTERHVVSEVAYYFLSEYLCRLRPNVAVATSLTDGVSAPAAMLSALFVFGIIQSTLAGAVCGVCVATAMLRHGSQGQSGAQHGLALRQQRGR